MIKQGKASGVLVRKLQTSGFPFQTAVAHVVRDSKSWSVDNSEYPWLDPSGKDEFLDLVIKKGELYAGVECKKTEKETLNFLRPLGHKPTGEVEVVRCLRGRSNFRVYCEDIALWPPSFDTEFCVVTTSASGGAQRLLERDARLVVLATNAFALHHQQQLQLSQGKAQSSEEIYISIIVTNAPINAVRYKPTDVSLKSGQFETDPEITSNVPWIRFRKAFTSTDRPDLGDRTVFVVHAEDFGQFLELIEMSPSDVTTERNAQRLRS